MIRASQVASFLGVPLSGADMDVIVPRSIASVQPGAIVFLTKQDPAAVASLNAAADVLCLTTPEIAADLSCAVLLDENPRLAFCKVLNAFFPEPGDHGIDSAATISDTAALGADVRVAPGVRIGNHVEVGDGTRIAANVVIEAGAKIGRDCNIKPNTTIGARGFGFVRDRDDTPISFPHIGTARIGDEVEIGANCTVVRAVLDETRVEDSVKTDDHVHIAHNVRVGSGTLIAAGAVLSGSVAIGKNVWIGPNATVIDYVSVGDGARIGLGSVVVRDVDPGVTVLGNPARKLSGRQK